MPKIKELISIGKVEEPSTDSVEPDLRTPRQEVGTNLRGRLLGASFPTPFGMAIQGLLRPVIRGIVTDCSASSAQLAKSRRKVLREYAKPQRLGRESAIRVSIMAPRRQGGGKLRDRLDRGQHHRVSRSRGPRMDDCDLESKTLPASGSSVVPITAVQNDGRRGGGIENVKPVAHQG